MFFHDKHLQYNAKPERPDPLYARRLQELIGGQWGEISVMMAYLFQGWNCRGPQKYRDMLLDIGTEEMAHIEMLSTMVARLLEGAPVAAQEEAARNPAVAAVMGGMNPHHLIVSGGGAMPRDANGNAWNADFIVASGNLLADFRYNLAAESHGRLQAARLYEMTDDRGVRDMLAFLIARDTMHQNQWIAAIDELEREGVDMTPCPSSFPREYEHREVAYQFWNMSVGEESGQGRWASGPTPDGSGQFEYLANPHALGPVAELGPGDPRLHGSTTVPGLAQRAVNKLTT